MGSRRRRAASASWALVASFSAFSSSARACSHSSAETMGGLAMLVILHVRCAGICPHRLDQPRARKSSQGFHRLVLITRRKGNYLNGGHQHVPLGRLVLWSHGGVAGGFPRRFLGRG